MIGVFVKFQYGSDFRENVVRQVAETARRMFEGMPGLRSKAFTFNPESGEVTNFYIWDAEDSANKFFTTEMVGRIAGVYGVRPAIEFVKIAVLVENAPA
jgi:hypothetical protein